MDNCHCCILYMPPIQYTDEQAALDDGIQMLNYDGWHIARGGCSDFEPNGDTC